MANDSKDIELRVRARDYSGKTLNDVAKALGDLEKAQASQLKSAQAGTASARELERSYGDIEKAVEALVRQNAVINLFQAQAKALEETKKAADDARNAQIEFGKSIDGVDKLSKAQVTTQKELANAVKATEKSQRAAQDRFDATTKRMEAYGISINNVAAAQQQIVTSVNSGNAALDRQAAALGSVDANIRTAAAATAAKAAADQEAAAAARQAMAVEDDWRKQRTNMIDVQAKMKAADEATAKSEKAMTDAMRISGQQAEASAKGYATLARAITSVRGDELSDQLRAVIDPAKVANGTIEGLEVTVGNLGKKVAAINGPVKDFKTTMQALEAAQKGAVGIATQIDAYQRQITVLRTARTEYANARSAVLALGQQLQAGGGDANALGTALTAAQAKLRASATAMQQQLTVARDLRTSLKEAGVETNNIASAQEKLISNVNKSTSAVETLSNAFKKHGAAVSSSAKSMFSWNDSGRTTLSYAQRLRGEVLALGTAYVGIQGGINAAKGALDAYRTSQKIESQLGAVVGNDAKQIAEQWDYLMATANRIGFSFKEAAPAYAKFAIAAKAFGFNMNETRFVFEKFAEAARVAGQSSSEFEGILKAVEQMLSKGTIQAEELRGQLGDRLPGAFTIAAKGMGISVQELTKRMEQTGVGAENVINIARALPEVFQGVDKASQGLAAAEARFSNAAFLFQKAIADNGFADAYTEFLNKLTAIMNSDQGATLAKALSSGFTAVIDVLKFLADNIEGVKTALSILIGLGVAQWAFGAATGLVALLTAARNLYVLFGTLSAAVTAAGGTVAALGAAATGTAAGVGILRTALLLLVRTIPALAALTLGIMAAKYAYDKMAKSKRDANAPGDEVVSVTTTERRFGKNGFIDPEGTPDPGSGGTPSKVAAARAAKDAEANQKKLDAALKSARAKDAKDQIAARADLIKDEYNMKRDAAKTEISDAAALSTTLATIDKQEKQALQIDQIKFDNEHAKAGQAAGDKRVQLAEQVKNGLLAIQDKLAKETDKLDKNSSFEDRKASRVAAITHEYDALRKTISKLAPLDKAAADAATQKLEAYTKELQAQEAIKVTGEEIKKLEKELTDQQTIREQSLQQIKALYDAGSISQEQFLAQTAEATRNGDAAVVKAADNLQRFADAAVAANKGVVSLLDQTDIKTKTTLAVATSSNSGNKINDEANKAQETAINNLVAKRTAAESIFKAQFDLRMISETEYANKVNANADVYNKKIAEQTALFKQQLETQRAQGILEQTLNPERLAALDAQIAKMTELGIQTTNAAKQADTFQLNLNKFVDTGLDAALSSLSDELTKMAQGTESVSQGLQNMALATAKFVAQFLLDIGKAIAKQLILNALAGSTNPYLSAAGRAAGGVAVPVNHAGGTVGAPGGRKRMMPASYFAGAPKFHDGGLPGMKSDEVLSVLQKGEQVLSKDDPDNVLNNIGKGGGEGGGSNRFVLLDDRSRIPEAMQSAEGERVMLVNLRKNAATVKQILG